MKLVFLSRAKWFRSLEAGEILEAGVGVLRVQPTPDTSKERSQADPSHCVEMVSGRGAPQPASEPGFHVFRSLVSF